MRSAYSGMVLCTLACASVPATSSSSVATGNAAATPAAGAPGTATALRGYLLAGSSALEYFGGETLHDVLRRRAPLYLRARNTVQLSGPADPIAVYLDGQFSGGPEVLSLIPASDVFAVQRLSPNEASMKFGPRHRNGALMVTLIRR